MIQKIKVSTALEKEIQPDNTAVITIDAYDGCQIQCPYCFQMDNQEWSKNIYVRTNIADVLKDELKNLNQGTELYIGSLSDPYMDMEKEYELTKSILEVLKNAEIPVFITTKAVNGLILRDLDLLKSFRTKPTVLVGLSHINAADKGAEHPNINVANKLYEAGIGVKVFITPVLPYIMNVDEMVSAIHPKIDIYIDKLRVFNQGNQNEKMYEWVKKHYPIYEEAYRRILFEKDENYYSELFEKYRNNARITFMSELWNEN